MLQAQTTPQPPLRLINVTGTGEVKVKPNEAVINLGVESRSKSLDEARKQTDEKVRDVIKVLKSNGIDEKEIQTTYLNLHPDYERNHQTGQVTQTSYIASKGMTVVVKDLKKLEDLMIALGKTGLNRLDGIQFRTSELEKHRAAARKLAVAAAREKANALTTDLGVKTGMVQTINEVNFSSGPRPMMYNTKMDMAMAESGGSSIEPGQITISETVEVSFRIE